MSIEFELNDINSQIAFEGKDWKNAQERRAKGSPPLTASDIQRIYEDDQQKDKKTRYIKQQPFFALDSCIEECERPRKGHLSFIQSQKGDIYGYGAKSCYFARSSGKGICSKCPSQPSSKSSKKIKNQPNLPWLTHEILLRIKFDGETYVPEIHKHIAKISSWPSRIEIEDREDIIEQMINSSESKLIETFGEKEEYKMIINMKKVEKSSFNITYWLNPKYEKIFFNPSDPKNRVFRCKKNNMNMTSKKQEWEGSFEEYKVMNNKEISIKSGESLLIIIPFDTNNNSKINDEIKRLTNFWKENGLWFIQFKDDDFSGNTILLVGGDNDNSKRPLISQKHGLITLLGDINKIDSQVNYLYPKNYPSEMEIFYVDRSDSILDNEDYGDIPEIYTNDGQIDLLISIPKEPILKDDEISDNNNKIGAIQVSSPSGKVFGKVGINEGNFVLGIATISINFYEKGRHCLLIMLQNSQHRIIFVDVEFNRPLIGEKSPKIYDKNEEDWKNLDSHNHNISATPKQKKILIDKIIEKYGIDGLFSMKEWRNTNPDEHSEGLMNEICRVVFNKYKNDNNISSKVWTGRLNIIYAMISYRLWGEDNNNNNTVPSIGQLQRKMSEVKYNSDHSNRQWEAIGSDIVEIIPETEWGVIYSSKTLTQIKEEYCEYSKKDIIFDKKTGYRYIKINRAKAKNLEIINYRPDIDLTIGKNGKEWLIDFWDAVKHKSNDRNKYINKDAYNYYRWGLDYLDGDALMSKNFTTYDLFKNLDGIVSNKYGRWVSNNYFREAFRISSPNGDELFLEIEVPKGNDDYINTLRLFLCSRMIENNKWVEKRILISTNESFSYHSDELSWLNMVSEKNDKESFRHDLEFLKYPDNAYRDNRYLEREIIRAFRTTFEKSQKIIRSDENIAGKGIPGFYWYNRKSHIDIVTDGLANNIRINDILQVKKTMKNSLLKRLWW